eukprot:gene20881-24811_t
MEEPCHRMAVGMQPSTYVPPHRHLSADKAETLLVLKGSLGLLIFSETGEVLAKRVMQAGGECQGVDLPPGVFHGLVVLEPDTLMFECKAGPYRPVGEGELASWAPREGDAEVADAGPSSTERPMRLLIRSCAALALTLSLPLAAAPAPLHITEYSVVVGNQRQSTQQPIPVTSPLMIRLKGKSLNKGATIVQVILNFDAESKSLKKPVFDDK